VFELSLFLVLASATAIERLPFRSRETAGAFIGAKLRSVSAWISPR
jgi:hypothetical protein